MMIDEMKNDFEKEIKRKIDKNIEINNKECDKQLAILKEVLQQDYDFKCS